MQAQTTRFLAVAAVLWAGAASADGMKLPFSGARSKTAEADGGGENACARAEYNKLTGKLSSLLPGSVDATVANVEKGAEKAAVEIVRKTADRITANIRGKLSDGRAFQIELTGAGADQTTIYIRVAPKAVVDPKIGGDEAAARMLLDFVRKAAGVGSKGRKKRFLLF